MIISDKPIIIEKVIEKYKTRFNEFYTVDKFIRLAHGEDDIKWEISKVIYELYYHDPDWGFVTKQDEDEMLKKIIESLKKGE